MDTGRIERAHPSGVAGHRSAITGFSDGAALYRGVAGVRFDGRRKRDLHVAHHIAFLHEHRASIGIHRSDDRGMPKRADLSTSLHHFALGT